MKKSILFAAFATIFAGCQVSDLDENDNNALSGEVFRIQASIPETKTTFTPPYKVNWDDDDALSVIVKDGGQYSSHMFTKSESGDNVFECTDFTPSATIEEYNVFYPYNKYYDKIDEEGYGSSYITFGSQSGASQEQQGIDSGTHIDAPMYGKISGSPESPSVSMKHAATLFEIKVTNSSDKDITISRVSMTNSENKNLVGTFFINPEDGSLKSSGETYVSPTANLSVSDGILESGRTGSFYITTVPFELNAASSITISVVANGKENTFEKTMSGSTAFEAGKINHTSVEIKTAEEVETLDGAYLIASNDEAKGWVIMTSTLNGKYFDPEQTSVTKTDVTCADFYDIQDIDSHVWNISTFGNGYSIQSAATSEYFDITGEKEVAYSDTPATLNILDNGDGTVTISGSNSSFGNLRYNSLSPRFTTYKSGQEPVVLIPWEADQTPSISVTMDAKTVAYDATSVEFEYSTKNIEDDIQVAEYSDEDNIVSAVDAADGVVTVTLVPNTENTEKTAVITLSYPGAEPVNLTITQNAYGYQAQEYEASLTFTGWEFDGAAGWNSSYTTRTVDYPAATVTFASANKQTGTITDCPVTKGGDVTLVMKGSAELTGITVTLKQWGSKNQTAMLYTSTNGGASYSSDPIAESGNFTLSANSLPEGTNAVKLSFSSKSNQVGIASFDITYKE